MYCITYRFTLLSDNSETRRQFIEVWSGFTAFFLDHCGALGSRLHHGSDGSFYAYAQWPSREVMMASSEIETDQTFLKLRLEWAELCAPSEVLWEGNVVTDMLLSPT